jgi:hypothetical protein
MEPRYRALRSIATIFKVLGWVVLVIGILGACGTSGLMAVGGVGAELLDPSGRGGGGTTVMGVIMAIVTFVVALVTVGLYALILIAAAEGIHVFLDIEENTREMAGRLGQRGGSASPPPPTY